MLPDVPSAWAVAAALLLLTLLLSSAVLSGLRVCAGHFGYPLDDTYIHMAMAKNFALHGVWGITRYAFSSSTSSPLFTLLLAVCYFLTGIHELTPFLLNCFAGILLLLWCDYVLGQRAIPTPIRSGLLCFLVLAIPLPTLILVSMEHVVHTLLTLIFAHLCCTALEEGKRLSPLPLILIVGTASLLVAARYEGVFLIAAAAALLLLRGMLRETIVLAISAATPLIVYGWISMAHGWYPIPNSLLLKANLPTAGDGGMFGSFSTTLIVNLTQGFHLVALILIALALLYVGRNRQKTIWTYSRTGLVLFVVSATLHLCLARVGWFFRYESYLVAFGIVVSAIAFCELGLPAVSRVAILVYVPMVLFAIPITYRLIHATRRVPQAISDIYCQQYQMGLFARQNLGARTIVLNDIGAVSFLSDVKILDLIGLGSLEPVTARLERKYSREWLEDWSRRNNASVAMTYTYFAASDWSRVARWTIPGNYISGSDTVGIYAIDPALTSSLTAEVEAFRIQLPSRVVPESIQVAKK